AGATVSLAAGTLSIIGEPGRENIVLSFDAPHAQIVVQDNGNAAGRFASASVTDISITGGSGTNNITIANNVTQSATILGGPGDDILRGGGGTTILNGAAGNDKLYAGAGLTTLIAGPGNNQLFAGPAIDSFFAGPGKDKLFN